MVRIVITRVRHYIQTLRCACYLGFLQKKKKGLLENQAFGRQRLIESKASPTLRR